MNAIIKKAVKYQQNFDYQVFESLLNDFDLLINKYMVMVDKLEQEDIYQELVMLAKLQ